MCDVAESNDTNLSTENFENLIEKFKNMVQEKNVFNV